MATCYDEEWVSNSLFGTMATHVGIKGLLAIIVWNHCIARWDGKEFITNDGFGENRHGLEFKTQVLEIISVSKLSVKG
jgi:hypothetical protein